LIFNLNLALFNGRKNSELKIVYSFAVTFVISRGQLSWDKFYKLGFILLQYFFAALQGGNLYRIIMESKSQVLDQRKKRYFRSPETGTWT
jgi:hypothetical protein